MQVEPQVVDKLSTAFRNMTLYLYLFFILHEKDDPVKLGALFRDVKSFFLPVELF